MTLLALQVVQGVALQAVQGVALQVVQGVALQVVQGVALQVVQGVALQAVQGVALQAVQGVALPPPCQPAHVAHFQPPLSTTITRACRCLPSFPHASDISFKFLQ
jgi:hypothetical protein